ncbi:MAG: flagellar hook-length control protein FliK [Butyrivibrio sp.]|jgi:hypothetical protein|uniref:flagellar hook-length control protein FliK n=1 Tax=Butyrivibrio sp. TaxID=28121 RepID=UPI001ECAC6C2|nr:flagellar hook-length control protein FliK [Butyrivibrio sp.]MBE5841817.1 flagellar hook-length control protein FliK [Butyrivibrio sp.]
MSNIQSVSQSNNTILVNGSQLNQVGADKQPLELRNGSTIQGKVLSIEDAEGEKIVNISVGDNVLSARLSEGMGLREGQMLNFVVKSLSSNNVSITPLYENTSIDQSTEKALIAAGLEVSRDNVQMVKTMMEHSLPIDKNSLQDMSKALSTFPNTSIDTLVEMKALNIPITDNNIKGYESYRNYEHQVINEMQSIIDELPNAYEALSNSGNSDAAMKLYGEVLKLFGNEENAEAVVSENLQAKELPGEAILNEAGEMGESDALKQDASAVKNQNTATFADTLKELGIKEETINKFVNDVKSGQGSLPAKELLGELAKAFNEADLTNTTEAAAFKKLFSSNEYNKLLKDNISDQWMLKPDEVENKENIQNLYQRLGKQISNLAETINSTMGAESKLGQAANNLQNNLDFMNQLNQMFQYVQLPLQMTGQNVHGDLYVYRNKNKRMSEDGSVSAMLHLDMENLGPVDVYVKMLDKKVSTHFYVADDSVLDLINDNIHILNERLEKRGYSMQVTMKLHTDEDGKDMAVDEMLDVSKMPIISTASFDARA